MLASMNGSALFIFFCMKTNLSIIVCLLLLSIPIFAQNSEAQSSIVNEGHRGIDFSVNPGYHISTKGGSNGMLSTELGLGKRINKNFYLGIGTGAFIPINDGGNVQIPITADFKLHFPLNPNSITPGILVRSGYVINTADDISVKVGKKWQTIPQPNFVIAQIMPTIDIPLSHSVDFTLGLGYTHFFATKGSNNSGGDFTIRTGFNFHKSTSANCKPRKPKVPTRDSGVQLTFEGGIISLTDNDNKVGYLGNIVATYKLNPQLLFGFGVGMDVFGIEKDEGIDYTDCRYDGNKYTCHNWIDAKISALNVFARGSYRLTDSKLSPFASCDAGFRFYSYIDGETNIYGESGDVEQDNPGAFCKNIGEPSKVAFYVAPAIGLSLRTTNNSYIDLKVGYSMAPNILGKSGEYSFVSEYNQDFTRTYSCSKIKMSYPFVSIGYTHTFKCSKNLFKK